MKKFIKLISLIFAFGAVATASTSGGNPEVSVEKDNATTVFGHCDPYERLLGLCHSSQDFMQEN